MTKELALHHALTTLVNQVRTLDAATVERLSPVLRTCDALLAPEVVVQPKSKPFTAAQHYEWEAGRWGQNAITYIRDGNEELAYECAKLAFDYAEQALTLRR